MLQEITELKQKFAFFFLLLQTQQLTIALKLVFENRIMEYFENSLNCSS